MKKFLAALLILVLAMTGVVSAMAEDEVKVMTYEEFAAAELDTEVVVECYVQGYQSLYKGCIRVYAADENGAYFLYDMPSTEEDVAKMVPGTKLRVTGVKAEWAGEVEITEATYEFLEADPFIAEAKDLTEVLANAEELIKFQNQLATFKGLTFKELEYQNGGAGAWNDVYVTFEKDGAEYSFCVESSLTEFGSDLYTAVGELKAGDVVDVTGYVYWYNGVNTHITAVAPAAK